MIEILYYAFIFPLQSVLGFALESLFGAIKSHGLSIIFLSLIINLILLKLSKIAESKAHKTNALKASCDSKIAEFKRVFKGAELQSYIRTLYKQRHYHPIFALSALGGLALQVPFFIAILFLLQDFEGIKGESFLWISDLSAPDNVGGIHLLPILMTIISLINVWMVAKDRGARIQGIVIAIIFLVLLYQMPSALVLYWTTNMAFSLIRAICNSSLARPSREFEKSLFDRPSVLSHSDFPAQPTNLAQDTRIADLKKSSLREFASANSWQSKDSSSLAEGVRGWIKCFFIFRKPLKIAVITLTTILAIGLCATFSLMIYAKDNVQTSPLSFDWDNKARIDFGKWDFLLRSSSISNVKLVDIAWDKAIDSTDIKVIRNAKRFVYFESEKAFDLEKGANLGTITYTMNFTPLLKHILFYYAVILGTLLDIYLLICCLYEYRDSIESHTQTYYTISNYAILCIAFLICVFTPYQLYNTDITQFDSSQTFATLSALFGVFALISFVAIYAISFIPKRFSNFTAFILSLILFSGIVYSFVLVGDYGAMDHFILQKAPESSAIQIFEFIAVAMLGIALVAFSLKKLIRIWQIVLLTLFVVSGVNAFQIIDKRMDSAKVAQKNNIRHSERSESEAKNPNQNNADILDSSATKSPQNDEAVKPPYENELFSYSKTQKNIVVIVLDAFSGSHMPHILEQFPRFKTELDGFTLYPNTISTGASTIISITSIIAGEYYTGYNVNKRKQNLQEAINEGFLSIGNHFADNGYNASIYTTIAWMKDFTIFTSPKFFSADNETLFMNYFMKNNYDELENVDFKKTLHTESVFLWQFGLFRNVPNIFKPKIYNNGNWHFVNKLESVINAVIQHSSTAYAITHFGNLNSNKPTFKFFHSVITHTPYSAYFDGKKCNFGLKDKSVFNEYPHNIILRDSKEGENYYQHYDTEICALSYISHYIKWLKTNGIYDNTQIFIVSDHGLGNPINVSLPNTEKANPDALLIVKDFSSSGRLKIDNRLMANYDIASIFCENLPNGCPNIPPSILKNYPKNRTLKHLKNKYWELHKQKTNEWLIEKAYKIKGSIYNKNDWIDISDSKYGIVNITK